MGILDVRTVMYDLVISYLLLMVVMIFLWRQNHRRSPELNFWLADYVLQFLAVVLVVLRGILPDFFSMVLSNTMVMTGTGLLYMGLERFTGKKSDQRLNALFLGLFFCIHTYFTLVYPSLTARNLNLAAGFVVISFQIAWLMLRRVEPAMRAETRSVGVVFTAVCLVNGARFYFDLTIPQGNDFFRSGIYNSLAILIYQMLFISLSFALFLMVNRRLTNSLERDIRERVLAEAALKKSQEKLALVFHNIPDAIAITTIPDSKIIEVNESFYRLSEFSQEEVLGKTTLELNLWIDMEDRSLFLKQMKEKGQIQNFETAFRTKSGRVFHGTISSETIQLVDMKCNLNVIHDISERKAAEDVLRRHNDYLAALQETTVELVSQLKVDSLLENIARRAAQLMRTPHYYLGLLDPESGQLAPRVSAGVLAETPPYYPEFGKGVAEIVWQTGQPLMVNDYNIWPGRIANDQYNQITSIVGVPLLQGDKVRGVMGVAYDDASGQRFGSEAVEFLTQFARLAMLAIENTRLFQVAQEELAERKRAEEALQESERRMSLVLQGANDGWWDCDLITYQIFYSPRWWSMLGYVPDELPADADLRERLTHPDDVIHAEEVFSNALESGADHYEVEYRLLHKDGHYVPILSRGYIQRDEANVPVRISGTNLDLTARKQIEEELRSFNATLEQRVNERTIQLESINKELESFAYSVSHDLRAPLRGIDGWSQVLIEDKSDQLDEQGRKYLERVRGETQRMGRLIDDLLKLSRITRSELQPGPVDLSELAGEIAQRLQEAQPEHPISFTIQPGLTVQGDGHLLEIALTNLLENAVKFSSTRPLSRVEFGRAEMDHRRTYYVCDNGVGFDMDNTKNLFGAFQRMHRQSEFPGNGIGLATVQRIIRRHGGKIWADARKDHGATFYFTLEKVQE